MTKIIYLNKEQISVGVKGKDLGLAPNQKDSLEANFRNAVAKYQTSVNTVQIIEQPNPTPSIEAEPLNINQEVIENPVEASASIEAIPDPVVVPQDVTPVEPVGPTTPEALADNSVIQPFAPDAPNMDTMLNQVLDTPSVIEPLPEKEQIDDVQKIEPVLDQPKTPEHAVEITPQVSGPEIIATSQDDMFEQMKKELQGAAEEYQLKITQIMETYRQKVEKALNEANTYKEKAAEHLKNAQAAEQIAHMAYQNSQRVSNDASTPSILDKIA